MHEILIEIPLPSSFIPVDKRKRLNDAFVIIIYISVFPLDLAQTAIGFKCAETITEDRVETTN